MNATPTRFETAVAATVAYLVPAAFVAAGVTLFVSLANQGWLPMTGPTWVHVTAAAPGLVCFVVVGGNRLRGVR